MIHRVGEPERNRIVEFTTGNTLIGPGSIPWEIGNAFSAMFKQNRLTIDEAQKGLVIFDSIPLRYIKPDFVNTVNIRPTLFFKKTLKKFGTQLN